MYRFTEIFKSLWRWLISQPTFLLVVHTATNPTLSGASAPHFKWADYFNFTVGNLATGETGRLIAALLQAQALGFRHCRLLLPVPYHCFSGLSGTIKADYFSSLTTIPEVQHLLDNLDAYCRVFKLNPKKVKRFLAKSHIDTWDKGTTDVRQINTAGECLRAVAYAVAHGFGTVITVSTGTQHAARALQTMFLAAKGKGLFVLGCCAEAEVTGLEGQMSAIADPPHLPDAPFAVANPAYQLHKLLPLFFRLGTRERWEAFTADLVALMRRYNLI